MALWQNTLLIILRLSVQIPPLALVEKKETFRPAHDTGRFVEQKLDLSCSFWSVKIIDKICYELSQTLFCCLSPTWCSTNPPQV